MSISRRGVGLSAMITLAACSLTFCLTSQATMAATRASKSNSSDRQVAVIRQQVAAINTGLSKMSKTTIDVDGIAVEGASATYYRVGKTIRKISATVYGESFRDTIDLYYSNGRLVFVLDKHSIYEAGLGSPVHEVIDYRLYFLSGSVRVLEGAKQASRDVSETLETAMTDISAVLLKAAP